MKDIIQINGMDISSAVLVHILNTITRPDPARWYNYRKDGDHIVVSVETREEK